MKPEKRNANFYIGICERIMKIKQCKNERINVQELSVHHN